MVVAEPYGARVAHLLAADAHILLLLVDGSLLRTRRRVHLLLVSVRSELFGCALRSRVSRLVQLQRLLAEVFYRVHHRPWSFAARLSACALLLDWLRMNGYLRCLLILLLSLHGRFDSALSLLFLLILRRLTSCKHNRLTQRRPILDLYRFL